MNGRFGALVRALALPVAIVFGSLVVFTGVVSAVAAVQGPDDYSDYLDGSGDAGDTSGDGGDTDLDGGDTGTGDGGVASDAPSDEPVAGTDLPTSCDSIFSASMKSTVQAAGLTLNPSWADGGESYGLAITDGTLRQQLDGLQQLKCRWLTANGGGEVGIETTIALVTPTEAASINSRLASLGYSALSELGGVRYVWDKKASGESEAYGESHIVRGDLWFSTHWLSYGPKGYTADVVTTVLG